MDENELDGPSVKYSESDRTLIVYIDDIDTVDRVILCNKKDIFCKTFYVSED